MRPGAEVRETDAFTLRHFVNRWKDKAVPIAKFAFEVANGEWHGELTAPYMFTKGYDPYFAEEISRLLENR